MNWKLQKVYGSPIAQSIFIEVQLEHGEEFEYMVQSDQHWDNPKCDRKLLKKHLDYAVEKNIPIIGNGDFFCAMQGKYDPRSAKTALRDEHATGNYLDSLVDTAVEYLEPYKNNIVTLGWGNHESSIKNRQETDLIKRTSKELNFVNTAMSFLVHFIIKLPNGHTRKHSIYCFHGSGGGGTVTKGMIAFNRKLSTIEGVDAIFMGHTHNAHIDVHVKDTFNRAGKCIHKYITCGQLPTYKEEAGWNRGSWHVERGAPPKPLGCIVNKLKLDTVAGAVIQEPRMLTM